MRIDMFVEIPETKARIQVTVYRNSDEKRLFPTFFYTDGTAFMPREKNGEYTKRQHASCEDMADKMNGTQIIYIHYPTEEGYTLTISTYAKIIRQVLMDPKFSVHQENIALSGYSSGGAIAIWVALTCKKKYEISFNNMVLISPPMDASPKGSFFDERSYMFEHYSMIDLMNHLPRFYEKFFQDLTQKQRGLLESQLGLSVDDFKLLPSMLIIFGRNDLIRHKLYENFPQTDHSILMTPENQCISLQTDDLNDAISLSPDEGNENAEQIQRKIVEINQLIYSVIKDKPALTMAQVTRIKNGLKTLNAQIMQLYYGNTGFTENNEDYMLVPISYSGHDANFVTVRSIESINTRNLIACWQILMFNQMILSEESSSSFVPVTDKHCRSSPVLFPDKLQSSGIGSADFSHNIIGSDESHFRDRPILLF